MLRVATVFLYFSLHRNLFKVLLFSFDQVIVGDDEVFECRDEPLLLLLVFWYLLVLEISVIRSIANIASVLDAFFLLVCSLLFGMSWVMLLPYNIINQFFAPLDLVDEGSDRSDQVVFYHELVVVHV